MSYYRSQQIPINKRGVLPRTTETDTTEDTLESTDEESTQPTVAFNIPTLIRILELIREDVVSDEILHFVVEKIVEVGADCDAIDMEDYDEIASVVPARVMIAQRRARDGRRI
jgi:hypothetical protein